MLQLRAQCVADSHGEGRGAEGPGCQCIQRGPAQLTDIALRRQPGGWLPPLMFNSWRTGRIRGQDAGRSAPIQIAQALLCAGATAKEIGARSHCMNRGACGSEQTERPERAATGPDARRLGSWE